MKTYDYEETRIHTPDFEEFTITGAVEEVELAVRSFGRLKEVSASTFDRAVHGKAVRAPRMGLQLGRLSLSLN
jgi:hypothetical protein